MNAVQQNFWDSDIKTKFQEFHAKNPEIYGKFAHYAFKILKAGRSRYGAKSIMERVRWHFDLNAKDGDGFKCNNNYTAHYARMLEQRHPIFEGFFNKRELRS